jgi:hypothetical protein
MKFTDKSHNWNEILIDTDTKQITRGKIKSYYEKYISKLFPYIKNKNVIIILGINKNNFVLKRLIKNKNIHITKKYGIYDQHSIEYWINRRAIEFHPIIGSKTNHIWVDIDVYDSKLNKSALIWADRIKKYFISEFGAKTKIWDSGRNGYHVEGYLHTTVNTNAVRNKIKKWLLETINNTNDHIATIGIPKKGQIRLDVTTLKRTGSLRAPYSFTVEGRYKKPI